jgi:DNA ligase-1
LKRKPLYDIGGNDTEYIIVDIEEGKGNWSGKAKAIVCKLPDGRIFRASLKGNMKYAQNILLTKESYLGKMATVQYQNLTPDGVPRFPIAIDLNRGNY